MARMATSADLAALDAAIASAELTVEVAGRRVTYRSTDELIKARAHIASLLLSAAAPSRGPAYKFTFATQRGE